MIKIPSYFIEKKITKIIQSTNVARCLCLGIKTPVEYCMKGEHSVVFSSRSDTCDIQSCIYKEMLYYSLFCGEQTSEIERDVTFCTLQLPPSFTMKHVIYRYLDNVRYLCQKGTQREKWEKAIPTKKFQSQFSMTVSCPPPSQWTPLRCRRLCPSSLIR